MKLRPRGRRRTSISHAYYREKFELIASSKHQRGQVELSGTSFGAAKRELPEADGRLLSAESAPMSVLRATIIAPLDLSEEGNDPHVRLTKITT
jgi:hypothetical protein